VPLTAITIDHWVLRYASLEIRSDRDFTQLAVGRHGRALQFASGDLRSDLKLVRTAFAQNTSSLQFADREAVLALAQLRGWALR